MSSGYSLLSYLIYITVNVGKLLPKKRLHLCYHSGFLCLFWLICLYILNQHIFVSFSNRFHLNKLQCI